MCGSTDEIQKEPKFEFNESNRSCTDVFFFQLFICAAIGSIVMLIEANNQGSNIYRVLHGVDYQGNICGQSNGYEHLKYAAWPLPPTTGGDKANIYYRIKICVASCEETNNRMNNPRSLFFSKGSDWIGYESYSFYRYCMPKNVGVAYLRDKSEQAARTISDMLITWPVILGAAFVALILSMIYVKLLKSKCVRRTMVWGLILLTVVGGFLSGYALIMYSKNVETTEVDMFDRKTAALYMGWTVVVATALYLLVIIFMRKRINLAINVLGATACAVDQMWGLIVYPFIPFVFWLGYIVWWIYVSLHQFSVKDAYLLNMPEEYKEIVGFGLDITTYVGYTWNDTFEYLFIYHVFHLFWVYQFIEYASFYTTSGSIAEWYFSYPNPDCLSERLEGRGDHYLSYTPVCSSIGRSLYHLGTIAFAALILAIIRFIRVVVLYIDKKTKNVQNACVRCLCCWIHCCLACCQRCIDYITRNALIYSAVTGMNLCDSGECALSLIMSNLGRASTVTFITSMVIFIGKIAIALLCTGGAGLIIDEYYKDDAFSLIMPMVIIFVMTYVIAGLFLGVFGTAMESMFLCYVADREGRWTPNALSESLSEAQAVQAKTNQVVPDNTQPRGGPVYVNQTPQPQFYKPQPMNTTQGYGAPY